MFGVEFTPLTIYCALGVVAVLLLYWVTTRNHDYWKKRGIPFIRPLPLIGSLADLFGKPFHEIEVNRYTKLGHIYGYYEGTNPLISVAVPALIKEILVKDFSNFNTRRSFVSNNEIFDNMVSVMKGDEKWKRIRTIITPTFTTGKIKKMLGIFNECSRTVVNNFQKISKEGKSIDAKRLYGAYAMDVIASSAFSTKIDSHNDPNNPFVQNAAKAFQMSLNWRVIMFVLFPWMLRIFNFSFFSEEVMDFYKDTTLQIIEERKKTGQTRNDFLQLLLDTANETTDSDKSEQPEKGGDIATNYGLQEDINPHILKTVTSKSLSMVELVAQCVSFFMAGYDTTASTMSFATYLLALNPEVQEKLRKEVNEAINDADGEITYEAIQSMKYLDNVISETLRLYPPLIRIDRTASADYKLGDTGLVIRKGMLVSVPVYAIQRDPKIYPEPEKFNPDRFTPEERSKRDPYCYLPFGAGPRNCVAMRFALMEVKICLAHVIHNFNVKTCPDTKIPLEFGTGQVMLQPKGIFLQMEAARED